MPADRMQSRSRYFPEVTPKLKAERLDIQDDANIVQKLTKQELNLENASSPKTSKGNIYYPTTSEQRKAYKNKLGKSLSSHQWAVYDFARTIPNGKVATYKEVAAAVGGSPRSVGNALRNNPFNPYVPCHRVIASNHFIGGFCGEWGKNHKTGTRYNEKVDILACEGVRFNDSGRLLSPEQFIWKP